MRSFPSLLVALAATAAAKTVVITAGSGGFVFSPDSATADVGDILEFHFVGSIHTAVQGDFGSPCAQSSTGFDSGKISSSDVFQVTVKNTDPMWFFCATPTHCQGGMVGVVNPPATGDTLAAYKSAAAGTSSSSSTGKIQGGVVLPVGSSGSSSSASVSAASSTSAATTSTYSEEPGEETSTVSGSSTVPPSSSTTPTGSSGTPSPAPTGNGGSTIETGGKVVLLGLVFGLGAFVVLMA